MAEYLIQDTTLTEIADAIRNKTGSTDSIAIKDMASKINNMETFLDYENTYVTSISDCEYYRLDKFRSISFPNVTEIGKDAFYNGRTLEDSSEGYNLITASFPLVEDIGEYAFYYNHNLTDFDFSSVKKIHYRAFDSTNLINISLPVCTGLYTWAFYNCKSLTSVDLPIITGIDESIFRNCSSLVSVNAPQVDIIWRYAFYQCTSLKNINIPKVTRVLDYVFYGCTSLETIKFPSKKIFLFGEKAFYGCTNLTSVVLPNATSVIVLNYADTFANTPIEGGTGYIYVPDSLVDSYKTAENWSIYASQIKPLSEYVEE